MQRRVIRTRIKNHCVKTIERDQLHSALRCTTWQHHYHFLSFYVMFVTKHTTTAFPGRSGSGGDSWDIVHPTSLATVTLQSLCGHATHAHECQIHWTRLPRLCCRSSRGTGFQCHHAVRHGVAADHSTTYNTTQFSKNK